MAAEFDPYAILGVARTASLLEIARAHRRLAKTHHPDLSRDPGAAERMSAVNAAWALLADPRSRQAWDVSHRAPGAIGGRTDPRTAGAWDATAVPAWRRPSPAPTKAGKGGWLALWLLMAVMVLVLVGGVAAAAMRPDLPGSNSPGYRSNLGH